jgi:hypothetical protein
MLKILQLLKFEPIQESEYQCRKQYKQWCSLGEDGNRKTYSVLLTQRSPEGFNNSDIGKYYDVDLGEERTAQNGKVYHFGYNNGLVPPKLSPQTSTAKSDNQDTSTLQTCLICAAKLAAAGKINITEIPRVARDLNADLFVENADKQPIKPEEKEDDICNDLPF